jgi:signal transduction histidine kinase
MSPSEESEYEEARLKKLFLLDILDTSPEKEFDDITLLAAQICNAPISTISFISSNQLFHKAQVGLNTNSIPRETSFCTHLLIHNEVMEVPDALLDPRFENNVWVKEPPYLRFYAGFPLKIHGQTVGALCVLDKVARKLTTEQYFAMNVLSNQVVKLLELRLTNYEVEQRIQDSLLQRDHLQKLVLSQGKILGYVAHDVRNPLASLRSIIDLNNLQILSEAEVNNVMDLLKKQLDATLDTLTNVIEWGQTQLERQVPHIRPVDLYKVVTRKLKNFEVPVSSKGNTLHHNIEPGCQVMADEYMLRFILRNLLTNANKFTSNGIITISVITNSNATLIKVTDTGTGISDDIYEKLFDPQNRVTKPGTKNEKGSGMGLLLVKEFIEKLGSKLQVITNPGKGTEFSFSLPIPD